MRSQTLARQRSDGVWV